VLSEDGFYRVENVPKSIPAMALPQTPQGNITALPQTPSWWEWGLLTPPQEPHLAASPEQSQKMNTSYGLATS